MNPNDTDEDIRLFSCVSLDNKRKINNLFTVYRDGRLMIGGNFEGEADDIISINDKLHWDESN